MGKRIENWKSCVGMNVLRLKNISRDSRLLYAILYGYKSRKCQNPFPSEKTLADDLNCSERTISSLKNELKKSGLITWKRRPNGSNVYTVFDVPRPEADCRQDRKHSSGSTGSTVPVETGSRLPPNGNHINGNHANGNQRNGSHEDWLTLLRKNVCHAMKVVDDEDLDEDLDY